MSVKLSPVSAHPDLEKSFTVACDASMVGFGGVCPQKKEVNEHVRVAAKVVSLQRKSGVRCTDIRP